MDLAAIDRRVREDVDAGHVVGLSLAVVEGDAVVYAGGFGRTSVEDEGVPITPETLFDLGSISKTFVAALVMRLVGAGMLDLDRPVEGYLEDSVSNRPTGRCLSCRRASLTGRRGFGTRGRTSTCRARG